MRTNGDFKIAVHGLMKFPGGWRCSEGVQWVSFPTNIADARTLREMALLEKARVGALVEGLAGAPSDKISQLVPGNGAQSHQSEQRSQLHLAGSGEHARGDQQGIARQEETYEHAGLDKYDQTDEGRTAPFDEASDIVKLRKDVA